MKSLLLIIVAASALFGAITTHPLNDTVLVDQTATFGCLGTAPLQWYRNDTAITGATDTLYSFTVKKHNYDDQIYCVDASNDTSDFAWLVITNTNIVHTRLLYHASSFKYTKDTNLNIIYYDVCYDSTQKHAPVIVLGHGISGNLSSIDDSWRERLVNKGFFVVATAMRGRSGSLGVQDCGAREIQDIVDATNDAINRYQQYIDTTKKVFYGPSGGGGNALSLATKFPDYFDFIIDMFGMSDYTAWYNEIEDYRSVMESWIGGNPTEYADNYSARSQIDAAQNAYLPRIWMYHDSADPYVGSYHSEDFYDSVESSGLTNVSLSITNSISVNRAIHGYPDLSSEPNLIRLEPEFINTILDTVATQKAILDSGTLAIPGYLKTKKFEVLLAYGRTDVGTVDYNIPNKTFKVYNGSTGNTITSRLTVKNIASNTVRASVDDYTGLRSEYANVINGSATITFYLTGTDSAVIQLSEIDSTKFNTQFVNFAILPSTGFPDTVYQGPQNTGNNITASFAPFDVAYGWKPPAIKFEAGGADSIKTSYRPTITSETDFAVSMWFRYTGLYNAIRGYLSFNENASNSYLWIYQDANNSTLKFRINVDNEGQHLYSADIGIDTGYNHMMIVKVDTQFIVLLNGVSWLNTTNFWDYTGALTANLIIGNLTINTTTFNSDIKSVVVYDNLTVADAIYQANTEMRLGPSLNALMINGELIDSSLLPMALDSIGISQFALYHTGTVDSVYVDGSLATSEEAGADSVLVTPASPMMWRSSAYPIRLYSDGDSVTFQYFVKKSLGVLSNFATSIQTGLGF